MTTARRVLIVAAATALAWTWTAGTDEPGRLIPDGRYLGDVRALDRHDGVVAVEVVASDTEVLVDAGALADLDLLDRTARPFRIVVRRGTIVSLETADDALPAAG